MRLSVETADGPPGSSAKTEGLEYEQMTARGGIATSEYRLLNRSALRNESIGLETLGADHDGEGAHHEQSAGLSGPHA